MYNISCGKVMFSQASVILSTGDMHGEGGHAWWGHVWQGCTWLEVYMAKAVMLGREVCMARGMYGGGACMSGGMYGRRDGYCSGQNASYWNAFLLYDLKDMYVVTFTQILLL